VTCVIPVCHQCSLKHVLPDVHGVDSTRLKEFAHVKGRDLSNMVQARRQRHGHCCVNNLLLRLRGMCIKFICSYPTTAARSNLTKQLTPLYNVGSAEHLSNPEFSSTTKLLCHFASHPFIMLALSYHACDDTGCDTAMSHDRKQNVKGCAGDLVGT